MSSPVSPGARHALAGRRPHKYRAEPVVVDGVHFAFKKEWRRWEQLSRQPLSAGQAGAAVRRTAQATTLISKSFLQPTAYAD
jgi:hypothetical protein